MIEFTPVICPKCRAVVMDSYGLRGIVRPICPRCKSRLTVHGDGHEARVTAVDKKPSRLPKPLALA